MLLREAMQDVRLGVTDRITGEVTRHVVIKKGTRTCIDVIGIRESIRTTLAISPLPELITICRRI